MLYLLLLTHDPAVTTAPVADDIIDDWSAYTDALASVGVLVGGAGLHGPETATTVRRSTPEALVTDGPFLESKEYLIGYYLIDVPDLDAALTWAVRAPNQRYGSVEVRPVMPGSLAPGPGAGSP